MTTTPRPPAPPPWQREKHLQSGDRFWILTDIERYSSPFMPWSEPQDLFRVGIYDLNTGHIGYANFGRDIALAILKAGILAPPWTASLPGAIELRRQPHQGEEKGRYCVSAKLSSLDPDVVLQEKAAKRVFARGSSTPNSKPGMWNDLVKRANLENAIETAVESMRSRGEFSAGDIKKIVGKDVEVTSVLKDLVARGVLLPPIGKTKGTRYRHAQPKTIDRADWTG